jgi:hypothetical protein
MKKLSTKTRGLKMTLVRCAPFEAHVIAMDKEKREWRYPVNLEKKTCSCRQWQISGLMCIHALYFITSLRGLAGEIDQYVDEYYSVAKLNVIYADNVPSIEGKHQWETIDPSFVLPPPPSASVAKLNVIYADNVPSIERKHQWETVDPGFVLHPSAGKSTRKVRIRSSAEGRTRLGPRKRTCKRCGGLGHIARVCKKCS